MVGSKNYKTKKISRLPTEFLRSYDDVLVNSIFKTYLVFTFRFMKYGEEQGLNLDYKRTPKSAFEVKYNGSFAYSTRVCSITGKLISSFSL